MSLRYRIARRLLGYEPMRRPGDKGVYVLWCDGASTVTIATSSFSMTLENDLPPRELYSDIARLFYPRRGPHGTFSGTIGKSDAA